MEIKKNRYIDFKTPQAAYIMIGDEIMDGVYVSENMVFLKTELDKLGIQLSQVRVIRDQPSMIKEVVNAARMSHDYVFTSGGLGPAHNDFTASSIASAFNTSLIHNKNALDKLKTHFRMDEFNEDRRKMAEMPHGAIPIDNPVSIAPGFYLDNVFAMSHTPEVFKSMFEQIQMTLKGDKPLLHKTITTYLRQSELASRLKRMQNRSEDLNVTSYPFYRGGKTGVSVVVSAQNEFTLQKGINEVRDIIENVEKEDGEVSC